MYEISKPKLITEAERKGLQSDLDRSHNIELIESSLQNADTFIRLNLQELNSIYLDRAEDSMARAVSWIRRTVNDPAFPIDKVAFLGKVAVVVESLYSSRLEQVNPEFVEEHIYGTLHHDLPALRAQLAQQHAPLELVHHM